MQNQGSKKTTILKTVFNATAAVSLLAAVSVQAADYSVRGGLGSYGLSADFTARSGMSFVEGDQLQWRAMIAGININDADDAEISSIDYEGDFDTTTALAGLVWYPMSQGFSRNLFVSSGFSYFDFDMDIVSESDQAFNIGNAEVSESDGVSLAVDTDQSSAAPYISFGWGNRLDEDPGFTFSAEIGALYPLSDTDVSLVLTDPNALVSQDDLDLEQRQIEDDLDGFVGFVGVSIGYHF